MIESVVIIGAGNLATQLALALTTKGIGVKQIFSRTIEAAKELAEKVNADFTNDLSKVVTDADLTIISVKDSAMEEVLMNLLLDKNRLVVHTAGSISMEVLGKYSNNYGVFYPLQTFSKSREVDFSTIPICIEAHHSSALVQLQALAQRISSSIHPINSEQRKALHLAAVFANNFANHMYLIASETLRDKGLDFNLLTPLIQETAAKVLTMHPLDAQTGPAMRNDPIIIESHLKMLQDQPEFQKIYNFVTESIHRYHVRFKDGRGTIYVPIRND